MKRIMWFGLLGVALVVGTGCQDEVKSIQQSEEVHESEPETVRPSQVMPEEKLPKVTLELEIQGAPPDHPTATTHLGIHLRSSHSGKISDPGLQSGIRDQNKRPEDEGNRDECEGDSPARASRSRPERPDCE